MRAERGQQVVTVRPVTADDWPETGRLRLEALAETPIGFMETLEDAQALDDAAWLAAVSVTPAHRGTGLLARMLEPCAAWARARGADALLLEVHEDNPPTRTAYERLGFTATGATSPYPLGPGGCELVMRLPLT